MNITIRDKKVHINMKEQLVEAIELFGDEVKESVSSPAKSDFFDVKEDSPELDNSKSEVFHSTVAKLLYVTKRSRPDLEPSVGFLTTRVSKSTLQDWEKLRRVLS